ncbi:hypothetical protein BDP27DRAFT_1377262 [Rhodocollybia butyracea]|uniref:FAD-binding domain-containing protein n=1 Tax=Rhodocollybia butyracea TaxID=206335 RepID=A0A9P5P4S1_9AGAR|nr:hypothetical protein BDP27DRAFT_1377262 [Rhodocollybia butyracea]
MSTTVPEQTTVLVIGGGPGGSYAAAALVREGHKVVILESAKHPRTHIGESLTAAMRTYIRFIGLEDEFVKHGFNLKQGALFQLVQGMELTGPTFQARIPDYETWNVVRSEMDNLMFRHAEKQGAIAFDETKVDSLEFENNGDPKTARPIAANWTNKAGEKGRIAFDWLVDASGKAGVMSTQYLKNRVMREKVSGTFAVWSYWKEVLTDKKGWAWFIPSTTERPRSDSLPHQNTSVERRSKVGPDGKKPTITEHYADMFQYAPHVKEFPQGGRNDSGYYSSASDYSYWAPDMLETTTVSAVTLLVSRRRYNCSSMRGDVDEKTAQKWHDLKVGMLHVRFLLAVMGAYRQMDLEQQNFDYAGELLCQGKEYFNHTFIGYRDTIRALRKTGDTSEEWTGRGCQQHDGPLLHFFDSTVDEPDVAGVMKDHGMSAISIMAPVIPENKIDEMACRNTTRGGCFGPEVEIDSLKRQALFGYIVNLERGKLGLVKPSEKDMVVELKSEPCATCHSDICHCGH